MRAALSALALAAAAGVTVAGGNAPVTGGAGRETRSRSSPFRAVREP